MRQVLEIFLNRIDCHNGNRAFVDDFDMTAI